MGGKDKQPKQKTLEDLQQERQTILGKIEKLKKEYGKIQQEIKKTKIGGK